MPPTRIERAARGLGNPSDTDDDTPQTAQPDSEADDLEENS